jgi:hypothetical protein
MEEVGNGDISCLELLLRNSSQHTKIEGEVVLYEEDREFRIMAEVPQYS